MKYMIVDDEPIAHQVIEQYAARLPMMQLQGNCYNAEQLMTRIVTDPPEVLFLDVQMPGCLGLDVLRDLQPRPLVVIISAHDQYALEGFELDVVDYLLKPFSFERFLKAVQKLTAKLGPRSGGGDGDRLFVKEGRKHHQVHLSDVLLIQAEGNFCVLHMPGQRLMVSEKISDLEAQGAGRWLRVHKSYLVAVDKIDVIERDEIHIGTHRVPIGRAYKQTVMQLLKRGS